MIGLEHALGGLDRRLATILRAARARRGDPVQTTPIELRSTVGYHLAAQLHLPRTRAAAARLPAVLLCPGIDDPGSVFSTWMAPITAA